MTKNGDYPLAEMRFPSISRYQTLQPQPLGPGRALARYYVLRWGADGTGAKTQVAMRDASWILFGFGSCSYL